MKHAPLSFPEVLCQRPLVVNVCLKKNKSLLCNGFGLIESSAQRFMLTSELMCLFVFGGEMHHRTGPMTSWRSPTTPRETTRADKFSWRKCEWPQNLWRCTLNLKALHLSRTSESLSLFFVGLFYWQIRPPFSSHQQGRQDPSQTVGHRLMVLNVTRWLLF